MNSITFFARRTSFITALMRSSNWPRYFVPATIMARSSTTIRLSRSNSGTFPVDDELGQPLDDGRLADAGLAEQHRIVLLPAAENLNDAFDLVGSADDRVELALPGEFGEIATEAIERRRLGLRPAAGALGRATAAAAAATTAAGFGFVRHVVPQQVQDFLANVFELQAQVHQDLGRDTFLLS